MSQTFFNYFFILVHFDTHFFLNKKEIAIQAARVYTSYR